MDDKVIVDVLAERARQDRKWGENRLHDPCVWLAILVEEVGELAEATLKAGYFDGESGELIEVRREAIQIAAVAIAFVECLDRCNCREGLDEAV